MSEIAEVIELTGERFNQIAPDGMQYDAEKGFAIQVLKGNDYLMKVAKKEPQSLQQAIVNVAAIGLSLSPAEKLAYLLPRKGKICLDISYMGLCRIATNSGSIQWVQADLVYSNDTFVQSVPGERPEHTFDPFASIKDRGEFRGGYCIAKTADGDYLTTMMSAEDILAIRDRSEAYKAYVAKQTKCPWVTDFGQMAKKTVVRRAFSMWPRTDQHRMERMALAVQISNDNEGFELLTTSPDLGQYTDEQKKFFDQLITDGDNLGMHVLQQTIGSGEMTNLYNSFEKGSVTKYKRIVDSMLSKGFSEFTDYVSMAAEALPNCDDLAIEEIKSEVSEDAFNLIMEKATK